MALLASCAKIDKTPSKLTPHESFSKWSKTYIKPYEPLNILQLEDFVETAITSYHPVYLRETYHVDTIRYTIDKRTTFDQSETETFILDFYERINQHIDESFEGVDLTIWKGKHVLLVQGLVFRTDQTIVARNNNCTYSGNDTYYWKDDTPNFCTYNDSPGELASRASVDRCYLNETTDPTAIYCLKPGVNNTVVYKLTPRPLGNNGNESIPCNSFSNCFDDYFDLAFSPIECEDTNPLYCHEMKDSNGNYLLYYSESNHQTCFGSSTMNNLQQDLATFILNLPANTTLYGLDSSHSLHKVFMQATVSNELNRAHRGVIVYRKCVEQLF